MAISGQLVEPLVVDEIKRLLAGIRETASTADGVGDAVATLEKAQAAFDAAIQAFSGLETEPSAIKRLRELRDARDAARARYEELAANRDATSVAVSVGDWDELSQDAPAGVDNGGAREGACQSWSWCRPGNDHPSRRVTGALTAGRSSRPAALAGVRRVRREVAVGWWT